MSLVTVYLLFLDCCFMFMLVAQMHLNNRTAVPICTEVKENPFSFSPVLMLQGSNAMLKLYLHL